MPSGKPISWEQYDELFQTQLPTMTLHQFAETHFPGVSAKAVGARARKLGVLPAKYRPTAAHRAAISKAISKDTPSLVEKVRELRDDTSLAKLAQECQISRPTLARIVRKHGLTLSEAGVSRALKASRSACVGKEPWNKGIKLPEQMKEKMAIGRQRMSGRLSNLQSTFYHILDDMGVAYKREDDDACRFGPWTFDCRIVHGGFDALVEVQGDYIHSLPKNVAKDRAKATYMERYYPNIALKYVWEHEFGAVNRIKQQVRQWLGVESPEQVEFDFADVEIKEVSEAEASQFLASFHYLGKLAGRIKLGAFHGGTLVAVSIWSAPTRCETATRLGVKLSECLELRRFVIHDQYHKKNFGSWLLARMEKKLPNSITTLVSFADPAAGHDGALYKAANWTPDGVSESSYFYVDGDGYVVLKKTLYNLARGMHMREADYAETYDYVKVETPPKLRFKKLR